jgi:hypothetical protein
MLAKEEVSPRASQEASDEPPVHAVTLLRPREHEELARGLLQPKHRRRVRQVLHAQKVIFPIYVRIESFCEEPEKSLGVV